VPREEPGDPPSQPPPPARITSRRPPPPARDAVDRRRALDAEIANARRDLRAAREREALLGRELDGRPADDPLDRAVARAKAEARNAAALLARAAGARRGDEAADSDAAWLRRVVAGARHK
jgi:hypothetical protein